jgi:hypothetical protein
MGVDVFDLTPHLNPPPPWGEELFFGSIGVINLNAKCQISKECQIRRFKATSKNAFRRKPESRKL